MGLVVWIFDLAKNISGSKAPLSLSLSLCAQNACHGANVPPSLVRTSIQENSILTSAQTGHHLAHIPLIIYYIDLTSSNSRVGTRDIVREADSRTVQVHLKNGARTWSKSKDKPKHPLR